MNYNRYKKSEKTEYKYIYIRTDVTLYQFYFVNCPLIKYYKAFKIDEWNLKDIAKRLDIKLIQAGREPINVLKKK